jgi:DNA-binding MarR family transcriptional regulator
LRTEWRVVFHLGRYGPMTAKDICVKARIHKTKVSRAVGALERKRYLTRKEMSQDRRHEQLRLTPAGKVVFDDLYEAAREFDTQMMADFDPKERDILRECLMKIAGL